MTNTKWDNIEEGQSLVELNDQEMEQVDGAKCVTILVPKIKWILGRPIVYGFTKKTICVTVK